MIWFFLQAIVCRLVVMFVLGCIGNCVEIYDQTAMFMRDGGGVPWELYLGHRPPLETSEDARVESFVPANPDDPVAKLCLPGDTNGYWYYNVTTPTVVPFLVGRDTPGFKDAAVIIAPGGGMEFLGWRKEGTQIAKWLNSIGISAFVLKYRLVSSPPPEPEMHSKVFLDKKGKAYLKRRFARVMSTGDLQLADAQRAVSLVRNSADSLGLNASRIGFMGFSAGGGLATKVGDSQVRQYGRIDEIDDVSHRPDFVLAIYGGGDPAAVVTTPPTFIAVASDDQCCERDKFVHPYVLAMRDAGIPSELHVYSEGRHGYGDCSVWVETDIMKTACSWIAHAELFIDRKVLHVQHGMPSRIGQSLPMKNFGRSFLTHQ